MNDKKNKLKNNASKVNDNPLNCHLSKVDTSDTYLLKIKTWSPGKRSQCFVTLYRHSKSNISTIQRNSNSLRTRLSCSHNSLTDSIKNKADDSVFITQAMSHDALDDNKILDFYNVPIDSDIYTTPIDLIRNTYNAETSFYRNRNEASQRNSWNNLLNYSEQISSIHERKHIKPHIIFDRKSTKAIDKHASDKADGKRNSISQELRSQCKKSNFSINLKQKFCNIFRVSRQQHHKPFLSNKRSIVSSRTKDSAVCVKDKNESAIIKKLTTSRKLPPLPANESDLRYLMGDTSDQKKRSNERKSSMDFTARSFSFGSCAKFKSRTIMEFIENAVEHSRSGRFIIHKTIKRKDLIQTLPLPRRVLDYLCYKNCLSERTEVDSLSSLEKPNIVLR
uniref:SOCS box domain-containing protein n=1 Tax=Anopheles epiroticus TaxID=199890 RepID=A0A182PL03_9DIPT